MRPMRLKPLIPTLVGIAGSIDEVVGVRCGSTRGGGMDVKNRRNFLPLIDTRL